MNGRIALLARLRILRSRTHAAETVVDYFNSAGIEHIVLMVDIAGRHTVAARERHWLSDAEAVGLIVSRFGGRITIQHASSGERDHDKLESSGVGGRMRHVTGSFEFAEGWMSVAADKDMSKFAGAGAISIARAEGKSVVYGGTHTPGIIHEALTLGGHRRDVCGFEIGSMRGASSREKPLLSFGVLEWTGAIATPTLLGVDDTCEPKKTNCDHVG